MSRIKRAYRAMVHGFIRHYLIRCAGAFHTGHYGLRGHYVVLMTDLQYGQWKNSKQPGLMSVYRDGDSYFLALPDFINLQESPVIWLSDVTTKCFIAENARGNSKQDALEVEYAFFDALGLERREYL